MTKRSNFTLLAAGMALLASAGPALADKACFNACLAPPIVPGASRAAPDPALCLQACGYRPSIDYKCVQQCSLSSGAAAGCPKQCSYYPDDLLRSLLRPTMLSPHNQFTAPEPAQGIVTDPAAPPAASTPKALLDPTARPLSPSLDYKRLNQCLQNGFSWSYCRVASEY